MNLQCDRRCKMVSLKSQLGIFLFALLFHATCFAVEIIGEGWGDTEVAAKREALADISSRISITVRSKFKSTQTVSATTVDKKKSEAVGEISESKIETNSELPLLGAQFVTRNEGHQVKVKAVLDSSTSLRLYESRLDELRGRLTRLDSTVAKTKSSEEKYRNIMEMFTLLDEFRKLGTVAVYLGGKPHGHGIDENVLQHQLHAATQAVDSLDLAAQLLTTGMEESGIYVSPPTTRNSNEITSFAAHVKDKLSTHIKTVLDPRDASYTLIGEYEENADGIDITYHLVDGNAVAQKTNTVRIVLVRV